MNQDDDQLFKGFRFPPLIIQYSVWLYYTFPLSFRDVELLLAQRLIQVSHETIRKWCYKFGPILAKKIRKKRRLPTDKWHLDEVFVTINHRRYYLWRAVDRPIPSRVGGRRVTFDKHFSNRPSPNLDLRL